MNIPGQETGPSSDIHVRPMAASDVPAVQSILDESPQASMWSSESLLEWASHRSAWVAELDGRFAGILFGRVAADEFEIVNLAVGKASRRKGVATNLLRTAFEKARSEGAREFYLEVRASNEAAISFYMRMGFRDCGRRTNYYSNPVEDAVILNFHNQEKNP